VCHHANLEDREVQAIREGGRCSDNQQRSQKNTPQSGFEIRSRRLGHAAEIISSPRVSARISSLTTPPPDRQTTAFAGKRFQRASEVGLSGSSRLALHSFLLSSMTMAEQRVSYTLDSSLETIDNAEEKATRIATELGFADDEIMQISMAVREGAVNAVLHGNAYARDKKVTLAFEHTATDLVITIRDQGKGIDLSNIPNPLAPENLLKTSGRGIFLMRSFMDVVEIRPSATGTELKLIKHVHGPTAGDKEASQ
jgi:serine/threonine-protein kinase RsbW